jgi:Zn-dependent protease with chaperone function
VIEGAYYDGRSARRQAVRLALDASGLTVSGEGIALQVPRDRFTIGERLGSARRVIHLPDNASVETADHDGLERMMAAAGYRVGLVDRAQRRMEVAVGALVVVAALAGAAYQWGVPWLGREIARQLPDEARRTLSGQTLDLLERVALEPSKLPAERQRQLAQRLAQLKLPEPVSYRLRFRSGHIGPNAFALPDGTIVLLDDLVALAEDDEQVLGVLAHELGHVRRQHGVQLMVRGTIVGAVSAWWLGDFSGLLAGAPTALLQARHSRDFEREADAFAAATLRANGIPARKLGDMLGKLMAAVEPKDGRKGGPDIADYLSSHPPTRERIAALDAD